jgi:aspartate carbamoyltransferase regulatory subunit
MLLTEKTLSVSAIKEGTVIDHITAGQALNLALHLKFTSTGMRVTIGLNLKSDVLGLKDLIKLERVFLTEAEANRIAVFSPLATVNVIEDYKVAKKFRVTLPEKIEGLLVCQNPRCITQMEKMNTVFQVEETHCDVLLRCNYCEKIFHFPINRAHSND